MGPPLQNHDRNLVLQHFAFKWWRRRLACAAAGWKLRLL